MKQNRNYPQLEVSRKAEAGIRAGHPWVYDTEITKNAPCEDGALADLVSARGKYLGTGFFNSHSKIRVRLISHNANDLFDAAFFERRMRYAWNYRKMVMGEEDRKCCRIIFGESDFFPGLTVDRFDDVLVTQTLSLGIEKRKTLLFELLLKVLRDDGQTIRGIYERNDVAIRELEGMRQGKGFFSVGTDPVWDEEASGSARITENGILYDVDYIEGQKTGFFLDQKYNRLALSKLCCGRRVLDCFTHTGSFALNAAKGGAELVHAVDISETALDAAKKNARLNHLDERITFQAANVFDLLPALSREGESPYDTIILDPPAFTKSRHTLDHAIRGYKEINLRAMKLLPRGGILATCSCSHFMTQTLFCKMLREAAADAGVSLRQIEARKQAPDHPILWNVPETDYLKFYIFQVV